jgi:hypothetical protein
MITVIAIIITLIVIGAGIMGYANSKPDIDDIIEDKQKFETGQWSKPDE